jgi:hypothetical protein
VFYIFTLLWPLICRNIAIFIFQKWRLMGGYLKSSKEKGCGQLAQIKEKDMGWA